MEYLDLIYAEMDKSSDPDVHMAIEAVSKATGIDETELYQAYDNA